MVQGYHTLLEAAQFLGMAPDELKQMAQRNQIRSFQDRGTLRFRIQDIQEMARRRGATSDPELVLGEPSAPTPPRSGASPRPNSPRPANPPTPAPRSPAKPAAQDLPDVFDFDLGADDSVDIGHELFAKTEQPSSKKRGSGARVSPRTPPKAGSDSDVKLVAESEDFSLPVGRDSDVKLVAGDSGTRRTPAPARPSKLGSKSPSKLSPKSPSKLGPADSAPRKPSSRLEMPQPADSGVRLVPMDSDSDVRIVGAGSDEVQLGESPPAQPSDSDIRLERVLPVPRGPASDAMLLTEEINLDEEIRKQEAAAKHHPTPSKLRPKSNLKFPTASPFELPDADLERPSSVMPSKGPEDSSDFDLSVPPSAVLQDDSSDFDVAPLKDDSDDFSLELPAEESVLMGKEAGLSGPSSGISLDNPMDAGISLDGAEDSVEFDLSLETEATPRPVQAAPEDSNFELSLDDSGQGPMASSDDSEFELTLDDSGQLAGLDDAPTEQLSGEQDIFETDFEVPGLDDSASQEAKLDTDLDSSDFDISLGDSDLDLADESGSQVVALDEEGVDDASETVAGEEIEIDIEEEGAAFGDLEGEEPVVEVEEDDDESGPIREKVVEKMIEPAPWGAMPVVFLFPCVVIMVLVGLMGFELIQSSAGYKQAGFLTRTFGELLGQKVK